MTHNPPVIPFTPRLPGGRLIQEDPSMLDPYEDWSRVRSPGRARRRRAKHKQAIEIKYRPKQDVYRIGGWLVCHPEVAARIKAACDINQ